MKTAKMKMKVKKRNKTKKEIIPDLSSSQLALICGKSHNNYKTFEEGYEKSEKFNLVKSESNIEKALIRLLKKKDTPKDVLPQNDFYTFINYSWMKYKELEESERYIVQIDDFRIVQNRVYYQLMGIVKEYIKRNNGEKAKQISNVYNSFLNLLDDTKVRLHTNEFIEFLDGMRKDTDGAWKLMGMLNKNEVISFALPFLFSMDADSKESNVYRSYISPAQLTLLDSSIYVENDKDNDKDKSYKRKYKNEFFKFINNIFTDCFGAKHGLNPQDVFDVECQLYNAMECNVLKKDSPLFYNRVAEKDAFEKYGFDWTTFAKYVGFKKPPKFFITTSLNYLKCTSALYAKEWNSTKWRTFFIYTYLRQVIRFHRKWRMSSFNFFGKFMRDQQFLFPDELIPVFGLSLSFNTFLTNEYIDRYSKPDYINYVKAMAEDLKTVFYRKIKRNTWLNPKTRNYALLKLKNFNLEVGSPKIMTQDPILHYSKTDLWVNLTKIMKWRTQKFITLEGKPIIDMPLVDFSEFPLKLIGTQSYIVNASYTPTKNGIYIPLGYIQKPFIDLDERGIEYNLAFMGFTLAHEMSHALDDLGSEFDEKGNMRNWWTDNDREIFKRKQRDVIKQYEEYAKRDGVIFDAVPSIGEDLADISGLSICVEYLKDFQDKNDDIIPIRILSVKAFLVYYAFQMRQKISKKAIEAQIKTNPHPLDKYRTNVPLSRLELFRSIYKVVKGDGMYWHSTDTIW